MLAFRLQLPLPAFKMKGTPFHRGLLTYATVAQKVLQRESSGTPSSSRYPGFAPSEDFAYWPNIVSS